MFPMGTRLRNPRRSLVSSPVVSWLNFNPRTLAGLQLWLDASDASTITASAGKVSQWNDKSGNGYHVSQATSANQPATDTFPNGRGSIRYDGNQRLFRNTATALGRNVSGLTIYTVHRPTAWSVTGAGRFIISILNSNATPSNRALVGHSFTADLLQVAGRTLDSDAAVRVESAVRSTNVSYLHIGLFDYANTDLYQYVNGVIDGSTTSFQTTTTSSDTDSSSFHVGAGSAGGNQHTGHIAEILVYHAAHDDVTRNAVSSYLNRKWAVY